MRAAIIKDGIVANIIEVDDLTVFPDLIEAESAGAIGDMYADGVFTKQSPPSPTVPSSVTRKQALIALHRAGILTLIQPAIAALPEPVRTEAQIQFDASLTFERNSAMVLLFGDILGLNSDTLDALFITAATIE